MGMAILLAEDDRAVREALTRALELEGHAVEGGTEVVRRWRRSRPASAWQRSAARHPTCWPLRRRKAGRPRKSCGCSSKPRSRHATPPTPATG